MNKEVQFSAFLGNHDRPTDRQAHREVNPPTRATHQAKCSDGLEEPYIKSSRGGQTFQVIYKLVSLLKKQN